MLYTNVLSLALPSSAKEATAFSAKVTLANKALSAMTVRLASSSPYVKVPQQVAIRKGDRSATFKVEVGYCKTHQVTISAAAPGAAPGVAKFTATDCVILRLTFSGSTTFKGVEFRRVGVRLSQPAPPRGVKVPVRSSHGPPICIGQPGSTAKTGVITIAGGQTTGSIGLQSTICYTPTSGICITFGDRDLGEQRLYVSHAK